MSNQNQLYDFQEFLQQRTPLRGSFSSQSDNNGVSYWDSAASTSTPATSPPTSERRLATRTETDTVASVNLTAPVTLSFTKGSKLFKLKYSRIEVCKDTLGAIRCIEVSDPESVSAPFIHTFTNSRKPIPHLEQPATSTEKSLRICFLEEQTVQVAQTIFTTQPRYTFERSSDCDKFQEAVLGVAVLFVAGVAEITSKGRGEEAISQNLRVCRTNNGRMSLLFFANSQRKEKKHYWSIAVNDIESYEVPKKATKPVQLKLAPITDSSSQFKSLSILFIDATDAKRFCTLLQTLDIKVAGR